MLGDALLDLPRLLVGVHVQRSCSRGRVAPDLLEPVRAGQARTEWGATPTATPRPRRSSTCREVLRRPTTGGSEAGRRARTRRGAGRSRSRPRRPPRRPPAPRRSRGSGTRRRRCSRRRAAPGRPRRTPAGRAPGSAARPRPASPRARPRSRRPRSRPRRARWKAWQCASTNPRQRERSATDVSFPHRWRPAPSPCRSQQLPNALTVARLALIPVFVALDAQRRGRVTAGRPAIVFGIAGITDQIDGYLARRWRVESASAGSATRSPTG